MLATYFSVNFLTVMILLAIIAMMYVNRDVKIPATSLFALSMIFMILLTVAGTFDVWTDVSVLSPEEVGEKLKNLSVEVMAALASAIDAKDPYTHGHPYRINIPFCIPDE